MIRKLQLRSNNICYGPRPGDDEEVEQRLTLLSDGRVWLSRYCYGSGDPYRLISREVKNIGRVSAVRILSVIEACFVREFVPGEATDIGSWVLNVEFDDGVEYSFEGSLLRDDRIENLHISDMIREAMGDPSLYAFSGVYHSDEQYDEILDYEEEYRKQTGKDFVTGETVVQ